MNNVVEDLKNYKPSKHLPVNSKVLILTPIGLPKNHSKIGRIVRRDGEYYYVKPRYCRWEVELYLNEIELYKE